MVSFTWQHWLQPISFSLGALCQAVFQIGFQKPCLLLRNLSCSRWSRSPFSLTDASLNNRESSSEFRFRFSAYYRHSRDCLSVCRLHWRVTFVLCLCFWGVSKVPSLEYHLRHLNRLFLVVCVGLFSEVVSFLLPRMTLLLVVRRK